MRAASGGGRRSPEKRTGVQALDDSHGTAWSSTSAIPPVAGRRTQILPS